MVLVKEDIVQLALINQFPAPSALVEVPFLRFVQLLKVSGVHSLCHSFHLFWWFHLFNCDVAAEHAAPINADVDFVRPFDRAEFPFPFIVVNLIADSRLNVWVRRDQHRVRFELDAVLNWRAGKRKKGQSSLLTQVAGLH
jgi:hypothetical protein